MDEWPIKSILVEPTEEGPGWVVAIADADGRCVADPDNSSVWFSDEREAMDAAQVLADVFNVPIKRLAVCEDCGASGDEQSISEHIESEVCRR